MTEKKKKKRYLVSVTRMGERLRRTMHKGPGATNRLVRHGFINACAKYADAIGREKYGEKRWAEMLAAVKITYT